MVTGRNAHQWSATLRVVAKYRRMAWLHHMKHPSRFTYVSEALEQGDWSTLIDQISSQDSIKAVQSTVMIDLPFVELESVVVNARYHTHGVFLCTRKHHQKILYISGSQTFDED
jgi:hypothetical protein